TAAASRRQHPLSCSTVQRTLRQFSCKKEKNCDLEADRGDLSQGDQYDYVALDPDSRLVLSALVGKRLAENAEYLVEDVKRRLGGRAPELITSDEYAPDREAIEKAFGREVTPPPTAETWPSPRAGA